MRYSAILAASTVLATGAVAAPVAAPWWWFGDSTSTTSTTTPCSTSTKSSSTSTSTSCVKTTSTTSSSSSSAVVASTSSSSAVKTTSSSSSSSAVPVSTSSSSAVKTTSSSSSSAAAVVSSSSSSSVASTTSVASTSSTSSAAAVTPTVVLSDDGYNYQFCVMEPFYNGVPGQRSLTGDSFSDPAMTVDLCGDFCSNLNYSLFGVEYGSQCYCGDSFADGTTLAVNDNCNFACAGDATEICGGSGAMNVYEVAGGPSYSLPTTYTYTATSTSASATSAASTAIATAVAGGDGYSYVACAVEPFVNGLTTRSLVDNSIANDNMTVETCAAFCSGYAYFGVEYSTQCYCGNTIGNGTIQDTTGATCNMACGGDATEQCGGSGRLNFYANTNAGGNSALVLPTTYVVAGVTSVLASTSSSAVATTSSSSAVVSSSSSVVKTTSSAAATSSSSSATVVSSTSSVKTTSSSTSVATTLATSTKTTSSAAAATTSASVCAPAGSTDLSTCPTLSVQSLFGKYTFNNYYKGAGYTLNKSNPGNLLSLFFPQRTYTMSSSLSMCAAASQCMQQTGVLTTFYHNFELRWATDSCAWTCVVSQGSLLKTSNPGQYFNVPNAKVGKSCGFSA